MELLNYTEHNKYLKNNDNKNTTLIAIKNIINRGNIERLIFCGFSLFTIISNNNIAKICLSSLLVRKIYKLYKVNKEDINNLLDKFV